MHRKIRIEYDCPACGMKAVVCERYETDKSNEELLKYFTRIECPNVECKSIGKLQNVPASRIVLERALYSTFAKLRFLSAFEGRSGHPAAPWVGVCTVLGPHSEKSCQLNRSMQHH